MITLHCLKTNGSKTYSRASIMAVTSLVLGSLLLSNPGTGSGHLVSAQGRLAQVNSQKDAQKGPQQNTMHVLKINNNQELHQFFHYTGRDVPLISAHRGGATKGYPENCIATFEHTLRATPAFFEVDPRLTKDGVIVLMHDETLDRTTTGRWHAARRAGCATRLVALFR